MISSIVIPDSARPFLVVQKGSLDCFKNDPKAWDAAYAAANDHLFNNVIPFVGKPKTFLDIGSGMGGIDILLARATGGKAFLLDGVDDKPAMHLHKETFNDMLVAQEFWFANGINLEGFYSPSLAFMSIGEEPKYFDLVVSFGALGFHLEPKLYLDWIFKKTHPGAKLIIDVRRGSGWETQIIRNGFRSVEMIREKVKFRRHVFERH